MSLDNLARGVERVAFGITNWTRWRVHVLLDGSKPDWTKLATITPAARELPKNLFQSMRNLGPVDNRRTGQPRMVLVGSPPDLPSPRTPHRRCR